MLTPNTQRIPISTSEGIVNSHLTLRYLSKCCPLGQCWGDTPVYIHNMQYYKHKKLSIHCLTSPDTRLSSPHTQ